MFVYNNKHIFPKTVKYSQASNQEICTFFLQKLAPKTH